MTVLVGIIGVAIGLMLGSAIVELAGRHANRDAEKREAIRRTASSNERRLS